MRQRYEPLADQTAGEAHLRMSRAISIVSSYAAERLRVWKEVGKHWPVWKMSFRLSLSGPTGSDTPWQNASGVKLNSG
jgi:hypothetical protein